VRVSVIRDPCKPMVFLSSYAVTHGLEKAVIIENVNRFYHINRIQGSPIKEEDLYLEFPFIEKERFYQLLNELIEEGILERIED
jgi:hypothetical protein